MDKLEKANQVVNSSAVKQLIKQSITNVSKEKPKSKDSIPQEEVKIEPIAEEELKEIAKEEIQKSPEPFSK